MQFYVVCSVDSFHYNLVLIYAKGTLSSAASPIYQEGQSERTFLILTFSSWYLLFFPDRPPLFPFFQIFGKFFNCQEGHSAPPPPPPRPPGGYATGHTKARFGFVFRKR